EIFSMRHVEVVGDALVRHALRNFQYAIHPSGLPALDRPDAARRPFVRDVHFFAPAPFSPSRPVAEIVDEWKYFRRFSADHDTTNDALPATQKKREDEEKSGGKQDAGM